MEEVETIKHTGLTNKKKRPYSTYVKVTVISLRSQNLIHL